MTDLMISYSRRDGEFVRKLHGDLTERGRDVWVDWEDIPLSVAWWEAITDAIEGTKAFVFVISPYSISSPICNIEIGHARKLGKRLIPILYSEADLEAALESISQRKIPDDMQAVLGDKPITELVRENWNAVARHNWISFAPDSPYTFTENVNLLLDAIDTDPEYVREHTRLLVRASDWNQRDRTRNLLLLGSEIAQAENWLTHAHGKEPSPSELHVAFITASRAAHNIRQRRRVTALTTGFVVSVALAIVALFSAYFAFIQRNAAVSSAATATVAQGEAVLQANRAATNESNAIQNAATATVAQGEAILQADIAATNEFNANREAERANSLLWSSYAGGALLNGDSALALALMLEATTIDNPPALAQRRLAEAAYAPGAKRLIETGGAAVNGLAYSPDGLMAAVGLANRTVTLYELETGEAITTFEEPDGLVSALDYSADGDTILTAAVNTLTLLDVESGNIRQEMQHGVGTFVNSVAISPNSTRALSGALDAEVMVWNLETGEMVRTLRGHSGAVNSVTYSADGSLAASAGSDNRIVIWDMATGGAIKIMTEASNVASVAFSPNDRFVAAGTQLGDVSVWDIESGERLRTLGTDDNSASHTQTVNSIAYSPDGQQIITGGDDQLVIVWNAVTGAPVNVFDNHGAGVNALAFAPNGSTAISGDTDGNVYWWSINTEAITRRFTAVHNSEILSAAYTPDGAQLLVSSRDNMLVLWDVATETALTAYSRDFVAPINALAFTPDGTQFLAGSDDGGVRLWDVTAETTAPAFEGHAEAVTSLSVSQDGTLALSGDAGGVVYLWDVAAGEVIHTLSDGTAEGGHIRSVVSTAFNAAGTLALSGSEDRSMILWDVETGAMLQSYDRQGGRVISVGFGPDDRLLYSGTNSDQIYVWSPDSTDAQRTIDVGVEGGERTASTITFSPDGTMALVGRVNGTVSLWNVAAGAEIAFYDHLNRSTSLDQVSALAFAPDGDRAVMGTRRNALLEIRTLPLPDLIAWAQANRFASELGCAEREAFNVPPLCDDGTATPASLAATDG